MSETKHYTGKLTRVPQHLGNGAEEQAKNILGTAGTCIRDTWNETWVEQLMDDMGDQYIVHNDALYSIECGKNVAGDDIFDAEKNDDGSIRFTVRYYDGGCGFGEAIGEALKKLAE